MTTAHPRRRFRYSLRTLMIVVTVFCIWLGILAKRARDQRLAVEAIRALGGTVRYEHEDPDFPSEPPGPEWLRRLSGDDYFFSVAALTLHGPNVHDANLAAIKRLTNLKLLAIERTKITDAGLEHLKELTNLQGLSLIHNQITDAGLVNLKGLIKL